jgi:hypothetical protein
MTEDECLRQYPHLAEELRAAFDLSAAFHPLEGIQASQQELRETKIRVLNQLPDRELVVTNPASSRYTWQTNKRRFAMTWVIIITTLVTMMTGTGVVFASGDALPGDTLYPVKAWTENVQLALASDEGDAQLSLQFAQTRMEELQELLDQERYDDLDEAVSGYETQTQAMTQFMAAVQAQDPDEAVRLRSELELQLQDQARQMQAWLDEEKIANGDQIREQLQEMLQTNTQTRLRINQTADDLPADLPDSGETDEGGDIPDGADLTAETVDEEVLIGNGAQLRSSEFVNASGDSQNAAFMFRVTNAAQLGVYAEMDGARYACTADGDLVTCNIPNAVEKGTLNLYCLEDNSLLYAYNYDYDWLGTKEAGSGENGQTQQGGSTQGGQDNGQSGSGKGGK